MGGRVGIVEPWQLGDRRAIGGEDLNVNRPVSGSRCVPDGRARRSSFSEGCPVGLTDRLVLVAGLCPLGSC